MAHRLSEANYYMLLSKSVPFDSQNLYLIIYYLKETYKYFDRFFVGFCDSPKLFLTIAPSDDPVGTNVKRYTF